MIFPKLTYSTHIHNISVQADQPLKMIKSLTATVWGKQKETRMATYKAVMILVLEYASSIWSPFFILDQTQQNCKSWRMQHWELPQCAHAQDANIQHQHDETLILPIHEHLQLHRVTIQTENPRSIPPLTQTYSIHSNAKKTIFNNSRYTTNIFTNPYTITTTDIKTNMCHIHTTIVSRHLATRGNKKYCAHLHHTLAALKRYFLASLVTPLPNSE